MDSAVEHAVLTGPAPIPERAEALALLRELLSCSREEKRYILEQLLRDYLGEEPPRETGIYKAEQVPYVYILEPVHRIRLFVTPERLAQWERDIAAGDFVPLRETIAKMEAGTLGEDLACPSDTQ